MEILDEKGNPINLDDIDLESQFEKIKDAPAQELKSPPKRQPTPKPDRSSRTRNRARTTNTQARSKPVRVPVTPELTATRTKKVSELLTIASGTLLVAGQANGSKSLRADGHTIAAATPQLSEAVANVAAHDPAVARLLDNEGSARAAAYVGLVAVCFSLGSQIAANHNLIKPGVMNTVAPDDIIAHFEPESDVNGNPQ